MRTLTDLPLDDPNRSEYVTTFQEMAAALVACQRPDGFRNVSLAESTDFGVGAYLLAGSEMYLLADDVSAVPIAEQPYLAQNVPNPFDCAFEIVHGLGIAPSRA